MKRLWLFDESPLLSAQLAEVLGPGWAVVSPDSGERCDGVVLNPSWRNWAGLGLVLDWEQRHPLGSLPIFAVFDSPQPPVEFLFSELSVNFGLKGPDTARQVAEVVLGWAEPDRSIPTPWNSEGPPRVVGGAWESASKDSSFERGLHGVLGMRNSETPQYQEHESGELAPLWTILDRLDRRAREVALVHQVFSRFLPPEVIRSLLRKKTTTALLTGEKRRVVALFSHIRDFSFYLEHNEPARVVEFLNRHFQHYSEIIQRHGGFINKYIGDAVFALFGAPTSYLDNADRALDAAIEIVQTLEGLDHPGIVLPPGGYRIGIGLNEGPAIVGNIGSDDSFDYTAIGDAINLATRLESLNKHYHTTILLSDGFRRALRLRDERTLRTVDRAKVKGKKEATSFYTVDPDLSERHRAFLDAYEKGLKMVKIGNWLTASEWLQRAVKAEPGDSLGLLHLKRVQNYLLDPPAHWDGAEELTYK